MNNRSVDVSVIVPMYNVEKYIEQCISSIQKQSFKNIEVILIDDGSSDSSLSIVNEIAIKDNRIKIITQKNKGPSIARNLGLKYCQGKYIVFVDSDDFVEENFIEELYLMMETGNLDICTSGAIIDFSEEGYQKNISVKMSKLAYDKTNIARIIFELDKLELFYYVWNKMYRRELIEKNNLSFGEQDIPGEDLIFNCKIFKLANSVGIVNKAYYHYVKRNVDTIVSTFNAKLLSKVEYFNQCRIELYREFGLTSEDNQSVLYNYCFGYYKKYIMDLFRPTCMYSRREKIELIKKILSKSDFQFYLIYFRKDNVFYKGLGKLLQNGEAFFVYYYCLIFMNLRYKFFNLYKIVRKRKFQNERF